MALLRGAHERWPGARSALRRTAVLALGWWALTEGDTAALVFGVPVVLCAVAGSIAVGPSRAPRWRPLGLARFALHFLVESLRGGLDVARRALSPRMPLAPAVVHYRTRLPAGTARDLFAGAISLMPGTLSMRAGEAELELHVLVDRGAAGQRELARLEQRVAGALGLRLAEAPPPETPETPETHDG